MTWQNHLSFLFHEGTIVIAQQYSFFITGTASVSFSKPEINSNWQKAISFNGRPDQQAYLFYQKRITALLLHTWWTGSLFKVFKRRRHHRICIKFLPAKRQHWIYTGDRRFYTMVHLLRWTTVYIQTLSWIQCHWQSLIHQILLTQRTADKFHTNEECIRSLYKHVELLSRIGIKSSLKISCILPQHFSRNTKPHSWQQVLIDIYQSPFFYQRLF